MAGDMLVQTRVPPDVWNWLEKEAQREGLSNAAWLRRLVMKERCPVIVEAWVVSKDDQKNVDPLSYTMSSRRADHLLGRIGDGPKGITFVLMDAGGAGRYVGQADPAGTVLGPSYVASTFEWFRRQKDHVLVLKGSPAFWEISYSIANSAANRVEITLAPLN